MTMENSIKAEDIDAAISEFINASDEGTKPILLAYKRTVKHEKNVTNLSKFNLDELEKLCLISKDATLFC